MKVRRIECVQRMSVKAIDSATKHQVLDQLYYDGCLSIKEELLRTGGTPVSEATVVVTVEQWVEDSQ